MNSEQSGTFCSSSTVVFSAWTPYSVQLLRKHVGFTQRTTPYALRALTEVVCGGLPSRLTCHLVVFISGAGENVVEKE